MKTGIWVSSPFFWATKSAIVIWYVSICTLLKFRWLTWRNDVHLICFLSTKITQLEKQMDVDRSDKINLLCLSLQTEMGHRYSKAKQMFHTKICSVFSGSFKIHFSFFFFLNLVPPASLVQEIQQAAWNKELCLLCLHSEHSASKTKAMFIPSLYFSCLY